MKGYYVDFGLLCRAALRGHKSDNMLKLFDLLSNKESLDIIESSFL